MTMNIAAREPYPGQSLLHPVALMSLGLLVINDRLLKAHYPGVVTGKVSDIAGLIFLPILIVSTVELGRAATRRSGWRLTDRQLFVVVVLIGVTFVLAKTVAPVGTGVRHVIGAAEWPILSVKSLIAGGSLSHLPAIHVVRDPTDLIALPFLVIGYWCMSSHDGTRSNIVDAPTGVSVVHDLDTYSATLNVQSMETGQ